MDNPFGMEIAEAASCLENVIGGHGAFHSPAALYRHLQVAAVDELHHDIIDVTFSTGVVNSDDVAMVQRGGSPNFVLKSGQVRGALDAMQRPDLDGHFALHSHVFTQVHRVHLVVGQCAQNFIAAEKETTPLAFQQHHALPRRDQVCGDETAGDQAGVGDRLALGLLFQLRQDHRQAVLFNQPAAA